MPTTIGEAVELESKSLLQESFRTIPSPFNDLDERTMLKEYF
jgi:hypothetical protein